MKDTIFASISGSQNLEQFRLLLHRRLGPMLLRRSKALRVNELLKLVLGQPADEPGNPIPNTLACIAQLVNRLVRVAQAEDEGFRWPGVVFAPDVSCTGDRWSLMPEKAWQVGLCGVGISHEVDGCAGDQQCLGMVLVTADLRLQFSDAPRPLGPWRPCGR